MEPTTLTWITAVVAGSVAAKLAALFFKHRNINQKVGPVLGIVCGLAVWQGALVMGVAHPLNYYHAGISSFLGGTIGLVVFALLKKK